MEQHRILNVSAANASNCKRILETAGISETFAVLNTGLVDRNGKYIFAVLVQSTPGRYEDSGIYVTTDDGTEPFIKYLQNLLERMANSNDRTENPYVFHNKQVGLRLALTDSLNKASYFKPRDENLLLDWTAHFSYDEHRIIREHLDLFLEVGVIDEHEGVIDKEDDRLNDNMPECKTPKQYKMYSEKDFHFRREKFGINACALKMKQWIKDAKERVEGTFTLVVPQVHYQFVEDKYTGRLQLLIPLFCNTDTAKLALSLDYRNEVYHANQVLKIESAYSNARLLAAPQATWII